MPRKLQVAVIGVGNMGKNHVRTYSEMPNVELLALADTNVELGSGLAQEYRIPFHQDYRDMITSVKPEAVSICVPTSLHSSIATYCLEQGVDVLLEKPIAMTAEVAEQLLQLAKKLDRRLLVGHIERFNPAVLAVKDLLNQNKLGKVTAIVARRVGGFPPQIKDANIAVDLAIHDLDIINFLLHETPKMVTVHKQRNHIERREDSAEFFLQYSHASGYVQANWITPVKIRNLYITGSEGYLEMDYITQQIEFYQSKYEKLKIETQDFTDYILRFSEPDKYTIQVAKQEPLRNELQYFVNAVLNQEPIDSRFALDALLVALH